MNNATNEELLLKYQQAEIEAFEVFYRRHKKLMLNFLKLKLGNKPDAEEAFQETFLRIHKYIHKYDPTKNAMAWVFTIARNSAIDIISKNSRVRDIQKESSLVSEENQPSSHIVLEAKQTIESMLINLNDQEIALITSRFINNESYEEIAASTKAKPDGVRQKVSRLVRKIKLSGGNT